MHKLVCCNIRTPISRILNLTTQRKTNVPIVISIGTRLRKFVLFEKIVGGIRLQYNGYILASEGFKDLDTSSLVFAQSPCDTVTNFGDSLHGVPKGIDGSKQGCFSRFSKIRTRSWRYMFRRGRNLFRAFLFNSPYLPSLRPFPGCFPG